MTQYIQPLQYRFEQKGLSNATSFLTFLRENDHDIKILALKQLVSIVDQQWPDISGSLELILELSDDLTFPEHQLASFLSSKVFYHLGDLDSALNYALLSGEYFDLNIRSQFQECVVRHCIDQYIKHRQTQPENPFDKKKEDLVNKIIQTSVKQGSVISALGISLDCERLDLAEQLISTLPTANLVQVLQLTNSITTKTFRDSVLTKCVQIMQSGDLTIDDWSNFVSVLVKLGEVNRVANILWDLCNQNKTALALQLAIDLYDNQRPQFTNQLIQLFPVEESTQEKRQKLITILSGEFHRKATNIFLTTQNNTDISILTQIKQASDPKFQVPLGAALMSLAYMQTGTSDADFLKSNLDWATKCNYWQRFTTIATLGMIYKGNHEKCKEVLSQYMPQQGGSTNPFENGGALYALGLINQLTRKEELIQQLIDAIRSPQHSKSEQVIHGACLGLGLISFSSEDQPITDLLNEILNKNESVYGEAAALVIGLIHAGSGNLDIVEELIKFSSQTDKEKIIRQLGTAIAIVLFGQEEKADAVIDRLLSDTEPFVRFGGCLTLAMAYVGTASNKVIQKLLHQAVNDVSDDVRRVSVISLAFVLFKNYEQIPKVMRLLILSYNPHIRYGTAMALGIACAGTMYTEAINMLEPMLTDNVDFVRQGALIAMSLVMMQANSNCEPKFDQFKKTLSDIQGKKHESVLVKLGVLLSQGILNTGGRNLTVQLQSKQGFPRLVSCVGMLLFTNYWYWFPMLPFFSLSLSPSGFIGLNENLALPKNFQFQSNSKPSLFGYPPKIKLDEKKVQEKKTATLSTTNKVRARQVKRDAERQGLGESSVISIKPGESQMSLENQQSQQGLHKHHSQLIQAQADEKMKIEEPIKKEEPTTTTLNNLSRVLEKQKKVIQFLSDQRYEPLFKDRKSGFIVLVDSKPEEADEIIELFSKPKPKVQLPPNQQPEQPIVDEEVEPPEEFFYDENSGNAQK